MLERHGIVTRETVLAEGVPGGFSTLYGELTNLELLGTTRRGYFVEGLGGAQFALPGAVERLRGCRGARANSWCSPRPTRQPLRRHAALAEARRHPRARLARPAPSCSPGTGSRCSTSSAAGAGCCGWRELSEEELSPGSASSPPRPATASSASSRSSASTARRDRLPLEPLVIAPGFSRQPRRLVASGLTARPRRCGREAAAIAVVLEGRPIVTGSRAASKRRWAGRRSRPPRR